ncbi:MAG: MFS transporter [Bacteroidota bacterium]
MTEQIQKVLRDSKAARWIAIGIISITMFAGYYLTDCLSPLQQMIERQVHWNSEAYGFYQGGYSLFNVFLFFLIIGGFILDKMGVRFTGIGAGILMVLGAGIKYWAITTHALDGISWTIIWTFPAQVWMATIGFAVFGVGCEVAGITTSRVIVKWFKGHEMALAMGLQLAVARLGTGLALFGSARFASFGGHDNVAMPVLIGFLLLCIGLLTYIIYCFQDKKLDKSLDAANANDLNFEEDKFRIKDIGLILKNKGWWYIAILCVLFYSAVFPFLKFAANLMINKFGISEQFAGDIPSLLPFGNILLTPIFGSIYDKKGKGATIMIIGAILLIFVHLFFAIPIFNSPGFAIFLIIVLGIGFSLVPSAMWPSVPKIIPEKQLGTAYALIFWIQNIGLWGVPMLIGWVLDRFCISGTSIIKGQTVTNYNYTVPMLIFMCFGILSILFAFLLKVEDKKKGYGLELPNIQK